jgi:hypothetical protein
LGKFVFVQYEGADAAFALEQLLGVNVANDQSPEVHEVVARTSIGFQPEERDEGADEVEDDDEDE